MCAVSKDEIDMLKKSFPISYAPPELSAKEFYTSNSNHRLFRQNVQYITLVFLRLASFLYINNITERKKTSFEV
jgi:hypothetical protein